MAGYATDDAALGKKYFGEIQDPDLRLQIVQDLQSVGVPTNYFQSVHLAKDAFALKKWVKIYLRMDENVLIFGSAGFGKTQIIEQAARETGYDLVTETTSTKLPEDYSGIPLASYADVPEDILRAKVKAELRKEKLAELVDKKMEELSATTSITNAALARREFSIDLAPTVSVSDKEIDDRLASLPASERRRLVQDVSAPDWVYKIQDNYLRTGKKTVLFLDEINQAPYQTLNALFQFVQKRKFGDKDEYSLADAVVFAGAGNFQRENPALSQLPGPLLDRFQNIICYEGDWSSSIYWSKQSYQEQAAKYPKLATLLSDSSITDAAWANTFRTPRDMEQAIRLWAQLERISQTEGPQALADIDDLDSVKIPERNRYTSSVDGRKAPEVLLADGVIRFLADIGVPAFAKLKAGGAPVGSPALLFRKQATNFTKLWLSYMAGNSVTIPGGASVSKSSVTPIEFYKSLFYGPFNLITQEVLSQAVDPLTNKSALAILKEEGISNSDLPTT